MWDQSTITSLVALVTAAGAAWLAFRKQRADERTGVIKEWEQITTKLQTKSDAQELEIRTLRQQINSMYMEMAALRSQIEKREAERVEQRIDLGHTTKKVEELQQVVSDLKQPAEEKK